LIPLLLTRHLLLHPRFQWPKRLLQRPSQRRLLLNPQ
jgi:hypothetical protein